MDLRICKKPIILYQYLTGRRKQQLNSLMQTEVYSATQTGPTLLVAYWHEKEFDSFFKTGAVQ